MASASRDEEMQRPRTERKDRRVVVGICAMDKKVFSAPMLAITSRLRHSEFIIVNMGTDIVRGEPVERWPIVDCLMAFYSDGFPLYKAEQYAALRQPLLVNDLAVQRLLWDRRYVYRVLQENGIAVPRHVFVSRDLGRTTPLDDPPEGWSRPAPAGRDQGSTLLEQGPLTSTDAEPHTPHQGLVRLEESSVASGASGCCVGGPVDAPPPAPEEGSGTVNPVRRGHGCEFSEGSSEDNVSGAAGSSQGLLEEVFHPEIEDHDDYIVINGMRMNKPLVEKPVNAEDHNICIYYPRSMGGGCKQLFRKVKNRSSSFDPDINTVRRTGSYIYEEFLTTQGTDIKVYTVGPDYAHAEARKSPALDGRVMRDRAGKEVRVPILLSAAEKQISWKVSAAFQQTICGFDLLRTVHGQSYVCDVNGFSFVKSSTKYHDDCAQVLRRTILKAIAPELLHARRHSVVHRTPPFGPTAAGEGPPRDVAGDSDSPSATAKGEPGSADEEWGTVEASGGQQPEYSAHYMSQYPDSVSADDEELRCVLAVMRHGDRTPKQKMKMKVTHPAFLDLFDRFGRSKRRELKLKSAPQLKEVLHITRSLIAEAKKGAGTESDDEEPLSLRKLMQMRDVLEQGGGFSGINRKLQLKPLAWRPVIKGGTSPEEAASSSVDTSSQTEGDATEGSATDTAATDTAATDTAATDTAAIDTPDAPPTLHSQASHTSHSHSHSHHCLRHRRGEFRHHGSGPGNGGDETVTEALLVLKWGGVLTDGGREQAVQLGTLFRHMMYPGESEGFLRLHSTYRHDLKIYASDEGRVQMTAAAFVKGFLDLEGPLTPILASLVRSGRDATRMLDDSTAASSLLKRVKMELHGLILNGEELSEEYLEHLVPTGAQSIVSALRKLASPVEGLRLLLARMRELVDSLETMCEGEEARRRQMYQGETLGMVLERWKKLLCDFYRARKDRFDLSKVPDVFDCAKHDVLHNADLGIPALRPLYDVAKSLADVVIPQEYGITAEDKQAIGVSIACDLVRKLRADLFIAADLAHNLDGVAPEVVYCLDKSQAKQLAIKSPGRNVRTRLYHTSESHIHTLLNLLRHYRDEKGRSFITKEAEAALSDISELDYLSHIVFRLYERRGRSEDDPAKFRVELLFSPGTAVASEMLDSHCSPEGDGEGTPHSRDAGAEGPATAAAGTAASGAASEAEPGADAEADAASGVRGGGQYSMHALPPMPLLPLHLNLTLNETRELLDSLLSYSDRVLEQRPDSPRSNWSGEVVSASLGRVTLRSSFAKLDDELAALAPTANATEAEAAPESGPPSPSRL